MYICLENTLVCIKTYTCQKPPGLYAARDECCQGNAIFHCISPFFTVFIHFMIRKRKTQTYKQMANAKDRLFIPTYTYVMLHHCCYTMQSHRFLEKQQGTAQPLLNCQSVYKKRFLQVHKDLT